MARLSPTKAQAQVQLDDGYLLALAQQGSDDAYDRLVRRYASFVRLKASSYFLVGGDSEDLIQEGLVGLYKAIRDFRPDRESSFRNFAELCITRQIITAVKTATRNKHTPLNGYVSFSRHAGGRRATPSRRSTRCSRARPSTTRSTRSSPPRSCARSSRACRRCSPSSSRACCRSTSTATPTPTIGEQLGCDCKTVDNALQRVKRKVGAHLELARRPDCSAHTALMLWLDHRAGRPRRPRRRRRDRPQPPARAHPSRVRARASRRSTTTSPRPRPSDRGWDRARLEAAARRIVAEQRGARARAS